MVQSVELLLDDAGDRAVRRDWAGLLAAGLPSQGRIDTPSNRPHITLAVVAGDLDTTAERTVAATAAGWIDRLPMGLVLGALVLFAGRQTVIARSVVPSADLLAMHAAFADAVTRVDLVPENMRPGRWTPHVTLARRVPEASIAGALAVVRHEPTEVHATAIRRWDGTTRTEWVIASATTPEGSTRGSIP